MSPRTSSILRAASIGPGPGAGPEVTGRSRLLKADDVASRSLAVQREAAEAEERQLGAQLDDAYVRGVAAGRAAAGRESAEAAERASVALEQLAAMTTRLTACEVDVSEQAVLASVLDLTSWVLRAEPSQASRSLLDRLSHAARALAPGPRTVVQVNEQDFEAVTGWARAGVEVEVNARLAPGEARLDRGNGSAILTFSAALRRAAETLGVPAPAPVDGSYR